ncbi:Glutamate receptor ionotropic, kainate 1 [Trichinella nelsoni]|uniref:Glutamate receptor ionotropic, kainate 1 n=1 Tax=Trichinella nelsoni TaxID=6336 RepID=A0A0V0S434_9BILA|nr:Glutamate receptor ionotropic, kainate 1 [Trichinella nelsoni]
MESFINNSTDIKNYMNDHYYWKKHFSEFENFPSELLLKLVFNVQNRSAKVIQSKFKTFMTDKAAKEKCEKAAAVIQRNIRHWIKLKKKCVTLNDWPQSNECNLAKLQEKIDLTLSDRGKSNMCISDVRKLHFQAMRAFEKHLKEKAASLKAYQQREIMLHRAKQEMETFTNEKTEGSERNLDFVISMISVTATEKILKALALQKNVSLIYIQKTMSDWLQDSRVYTDDLKVLFQEKHNELTPVMGKYTTINNITFIQNVEMGFYWIFSNLKGREIYYIAKWKLNSGIDIFYKTGLSDAIVNARHYRIATVEEVPFVKMCYEPNTSKWFLCGFLVEIMGIIAERLNFTYDIYILKNDEYGVQNNVGRWNGLTNELVEGDANIALANFATSAERELFIDFTYPFYKSKGITILMQKPECKHSLFAFVSLMDWSVWLCLVFTVLIASALLTLFENVHSHDCETDHIKYDNDKKRTRFPFSEGFWFCLEGFTVQGSNWTPEHDSGRILATTWWIFCFMIFSAYTAYISALMSKSSEENLISSLDDLVDQRHTPYATVLNSDADLFIKRMVEIENLFEKTWKKDIQSPNLTAEQRVNMALWDYDIKYKFSKMLHEMQNAHQPSSFTEGLQRVLKLNSPEDRFALLDMRMSMEYEFMHHCPLRLIYTNLDARLYAIGVQQGSPLGIIYDENEEDASLSKLITLFQTIFMYQHSVGYPTDRKFDIKIEVSNDVKYNESINVPIIFINFSNKKDIISQLSSLSVTNDIPVVQLYLESWSYSSSETEQFEDPSNFVTLVPPWIVAMGFLKSFRKRERVLSFTILYDEDHDYYTVAYSLQQSKTGKSTAIKLSPETDSQWMPMCSGPNENITVRTFIMICNVGTAEKYAARLEKCVLFGYVNLIVFTMVKISFFMDLSALILAQFNQWKENSTLSDTTVNCFVEQSQHYQQFKNECKWYCPYGSYIAFEKSVFAQDIVLNTYRIEANHEYKDIYLVGNWTMSRGIRYVNKFGFSLEATKVRHFRVATSVLPPFIEEYSEYPGGPLKLRGLCIDLLEILSKSCNFTYEISEILESVGVYNAIGRWNGIAGELIVGNANIGLMTFVSTPENEDIIDFTYPFYERTGLALLLLKQDYNVTVFNSVTLMEWPVWICTCLAILIMSAVLTVIDQCSPFSYRNNRSNYGEDDPDNCIFTYKESLWFCLRSFTPQAAMFSATRVVTTVTSLEDLLEQSRIRYSAVLHSAAEAYIQRQADIEANFYEKWKVAVKSKKLTPIQRVSLSNWDYPMKDKFTEMLRLMKEVGQPLDVASGVRRVLETNFLNERFALIGQQSVFEYEALLHCELEVVPLNLNLLPYVIAVQEGSSLRMNLSKGILELVNQQKMLQLKKKWMDDNPNKKDCSSYATITGMSIMDIMGISKELSSQSEDISTLKNNNQLGQKKCNHNFQSMRHKLWKAPHSHMDSRLIEAVYVDFRLIKFPKSAKETLAKQYGMFEKRRSDLVNRATWRCLTCNGRNIDALSYCNLCMFPRSSETILPKSTPLNTEKSTVGNMSSEKHGVQGELNLKMPNENKRSGEMSSNSFTKKFKPSEKCTICGLLLDFGSGRKCSSCEKFNFYEPVNDVRRNVMRTTKSFDSTIRKRWWNRRRFASEQTSVLSGWTCKGYSVEGGISSSAWKCPACFVSNDDTNSKRCVNCLALRPSKFSMKNEKCWRCTGCCVLNSGNFDNCLQCRMPRSILKENTSDVSSSNSQSLTVSHDETAGDVQKFPDESSSTKSDLPKWYCTICFLGNAAEQLFCSSCNAPKPGSVFKSVSINFATTTEDESTDVAENGKTVVDDSSTSVGTREGSGDSNTSAVHFKAPDLSPPPSPPGTTETQADFVEAQADEEHLFKFGQPQPKSNEQQQQQQLNTSDRVLRSALKRGNRKICKRKVHFSEPLHTETVFNSDSSVLSITGCSETSAASSLQVCSTPTLPPTTTTTTSSTVESTNIVTSSINSPTAGLFSKFSFPATGKENISEQKATSTSPSVRLGIESEPVLSKKTAKRALFPDSDELTTSAPSFTFNFGQQKASTVAVTSSEDTKISSATVSPADVITNAFKVAETDLSSLSFPVFQFGASTGDPTPSKSSSTTPVSSENVLSSQTSSASGDIFTFGTGNFPSTTNIITTPATTTTTISSSSSSSSSSFVFNFGSTAAQSSPFAKPFTFPTFSSKTPTLSTQSIATNSRLSLPCLTTTASTTKTASFPTFSFPTPTSVPFAFNFGSSKSEASVTATTTTTPAGATFNFGFPTVVTTSSTSSAGTPFFSFSANAASAAAASQAPMNNSGFNFQIPSSTPAFGSNIAASMAPTFNFSTAPPSVVGAGVGTSAQPQIGTPFAGASDTSSSVSKRPMIIARRKKRRA